MIRIALVILCLGLPQLCVAVAVAVPPGMSAPHPQSLAVRVQYLRFDGQRAGPQPQGARKLPANRERGIGHPGRLPVHTRALSVIAGNLQRPGRPGGSHSRRMSRLKVTGASPVHSRRASRVAGKPGETHRRWISSRENAGNRPAHRRRASNANTAENSCAAGSVWRNGRCHRRRASIAIAVGPRPRPPLVANDPQLRPQPPKIAAPRTPPRPPAGPAQPPRFAAPLPAVTALLEQGPHRPRDVIVAISAEPDVRDGLMRDYNLEAGPVREIALIGARILRLSALDNRPLATVISALQADPRVLSVQPNYIYGLDGEAAGLRAAQYNLDAIRAPAAHRVASGRNVRVAVIDTCVDAKHPDLGDAVAESFDALSGEASTCRGAEFHGTAVAGIIAARASLQGVAPAVEVLAARAFGAGETSAIEGTSETLLRALDWAVAGQARILNLSFTGPRDALLEAGVAAAIERGAVLVAAAGNKGRGAAPLYPAAYPGVIAVSATDARNAVYTNANTGPHVAISAPGVDVLTLRPEKAYDFGSGTSFAAAHVSGVLALIIERNPEFTADEATAALLGTARDLGAEGRDEVFGAGLTDAEHAVMGAQDALRKASAAR